MKLKSDAKKLPFSCPICGRVTDRPLDELKEDAPIVCPFCGLELTLHGHMWEEVKQRMEEL